MAAFESEYLKRNFIITGHDANVVLKGYQGPLSRIRAPRLVREMIARGSNLVALKPTQAKKSRPKKTTV